MYTFFREVDPGLIYSKNLYFGQYKVPAVTPILQGNGSGMDGFIIVYKLIRLKPYV